MKKYNRDSRGYTLDFENGGLPVFNDDLKQLEINTTISSVYGLLKGFSCILSGCLITNVNTTTKTCNLSEGLVLIGDIVYQVSALTNQTYPFSIIQGDETDDVRGFADNNYYTVATTYNYSIRTNFIFDDVLDLYPSNINSEGKEIYFDPFSAQRAEYIIENINKGKGEMLLKNISTTSITKDERGGNIVGSTSWLSSGVYTKYKYYGYSVLSNSAGKLSLNSSAGSSTGSNSLTLVSNNIPAHNHTLGSNGFTTQDGGHFHNFNNAFNSENLIPTTGKVFAYGVSSRLTNKNDIIAPTIGLSSAGKDFDNNPLAFSDITYTNGLHSHGLGGTTDNNTTTNSSIDITGKEYGVQGLVWNGYPTTFEVSNPSSGTGVQIIAYKFWEDTIRIPNM